ncbi:MAG: hypothetical protein ABIU54_01665 [Candidatus Eisenbacteria bacterium]
MRAGFDFAPATARAALMFACACCACPARAQEFGGAAIPGEARGAGAMLEHGLAGAASAGAEVGVTRWFALPSLETRALALGVAMRSLRVAVGVASTGEPAVGWDAGALAVGVKQPGFAVAARAVLRRDREWFAAPPGVLGRAVGAEAGAGAWMQAARAVRVWVSAPQLWSRGVAPPLARPLESGVRFGGEQVAGWLVLRSPRGGDDGARAAGAMLGRGPLVCWAEITDAPLRASVGVRAERGRLACAVRLDAHPILGETTHCSLAWTPQRRERS